MQGQLQRYFAALAAFAVATTWSVAGTVVALVSLVVAGGAYGVVVFAQRRPRLPSLPAWPACRPVSTTRTPARRSQSIRDWPAFEHDHDAEHDHDEAPALAAGPAAGEYGW